MTKLFTFASCTKHSLIHSGQLGWQKNKNDQKSNAHIYLGFEQSETNKKINQVLWGL